MNLSIIIPSHNHGAFISDAIASARNQSFGPSDVVVVDDGSTDDTESIVRGIGGVTYIWQENKGVAAARNAGLRTATSRYVIFLDADDLLDAGFAEACFEALASTGACFAYPSVQFFGNDTRTFPARPYELDKLRWHNFIPVTALVDREQTSGVRFDGDIRLGCWQDWEFFLHLAALGRRGEPASNAVLYYRKHPTPTSLFDRTNANPAAQLRALRCIQQKHSTLYSRRERLGTALRSASHTFRTGR